MHPTHAAERGEPVAIKPTNTRPTPSKGYYHSIPDAANPRWATLVLTGVPMGLLAFSRRLPDMVPGVHYWPVGSVNASIVEGCIAGLEQLNDGLYEAHAEALKAAQKAALKENYVYSVMYDPETDGWWVMLSGARRYRNWRQLGLFSSTVAVFKDWAELSAMQYDPAEIDVSDLVKIDVAAMLRNANISLVKLKRPPTWTSREATKPYLHKTGADRASGPIDYDTLPQPDQRAPEYDMPYLGEAGQMVFDESPGTSPDIPEHLRDIPEYLARQLMPKAATPIQREPVAAEPVVQERNPYDLTDPNWEHPLLADRKKEGLFWK